jgi:hypothetical protein
VHTTSRPPTHEPTAPPKPQRQRRGALAALLAVTGAALVTAAWVYLLILVAYWIISALI